MSKSMMLPKEKANKPIMVNSIDPKLVISISTVAIDLCLETSIKLATKRMISPNKYNTLGI